MVKSRFDSLLQFFDNLPFRKARVKGLGKETTVYVVYPYGLTANAPLGALLVQVAGNESDRVEIVDYPQIRPKDLEPGEVAVSNYLTKSEVRFKANGDVDVTSVAKVNITAATEVNIVAGSDVNIDAVTKITVTAPDIALVGNVGITGNLATIGTVLNNGTTIGSDHIHSQGNDSAGDSEVDTGTPHA